MTQEQVLENNKLIAEFDGWIYHSDYELNGCKGVLTKKGKGSLLLDTDQPFHVKYHSSYDWLMPVVEKIYKLYEWNTFYYNPKMVYFYLSAKIKIYVGSSNDDFGTCGKMEYKYIKCDNNPLFVAVVEFIKWYNQNKTVV